MPLIRMNSLKSLAMNCGPLSEMIRGRASGHFSFAPCKMISMAALFPKRLTLVCMPGAKRTIFADVPLRSVCEIEMRRGGGGRVFDPRSLARKIGKCDLFASLHSWHSPSVDGLLKL